MTVPDFFLQYLNCILKASKAFDTHSMYNSSNKNAVGKEQVLKKFAGSGRAGALSPPVPSSSLPA